MQTTLLSRQQQFQAQQQNFHPEFSAYPQSPHAIKHYRGLVTPPSPGHRVQIQGGGGGGPLAQRGSPRSSSPNWIDKDEREEQDDGAVADGAEMDPTLALIDDDLEDKAESHSLGEAIPSTTEVLHQLSQDPNVVLSTFSAQPWWARLGLHWVSSTCYLFWLVFCSLVYC